MTDESLSKPIIWLVNGQGEVKSFANSYITNSNIPTALGKDQTFTSHYSCNFGLSYAHKIELHLCRGTS